MLNWIKSLNKKPSSKKSEPEKTPRNGRKSHAAKPARQGSTATRTAVRNNAVIFSRAEHGISRQDIDKHALKVLYRLHNAGYHACLVGGAVRDLLLGVKPKDFDVATDATPEQVSRLFRNCRIIGRRFRLAHIHFGRQIIEVATFRASHELHPSGVQNETGRIVRDNVFGELADDVWRRDFTANALYYDISDFSVIDFVGGYEDIKQQRLHLIGDVETRYREDPVRMLRALRFAAKLQFEIDDESRLPIYTLGHLLKDIPAARLYEEVLKLFHSGHAVRSFALLVEFDLLKYLFPAAARSVSGDPAVQRMLNIAMQSTDQRVLNDLHVTPAFLLAALLWYPLKEDVDKLVDKGMPYSVAIQKAATRILGQQSASVSIPRRFTSIMREIWALQTRFHYRSGKRAQGVLEHARFRAAYDFLCIRARAGEADAGEQLTQDCEWWTELQKQTAEAQHNTLFSQVKKQPVKRKRSRRRNKKQKPDLPV